MKKMKEIIIDDIEVSAFESSHNYDVIILKYTSNIGWGEYTLYRTEDGQWHGDSECMDSNNDKSFLKLLINKFIEEIDVR